LSKTFTLDEAQTLLPVLEGLLRRAQSSGTRAAELEAATQRRNIATDKTDGHR